MPKTIQNLTHIAVVAHPHVAAAVEEATKISAFLRTQELHVTSGQLYDDSLVAQVEKSEFDLLIALGGDGTMLRAGHICGPSSVPILGINLGRFGFLMEIRRDEWLEYLPKLLVGDFWLENRMMLGARQFRGEHVLGTWDILNEIVVSRGQFMRPVHLIAEVDGRYLTTYVADGLIASTPTGSTAYALAAGGPILPPELRAILLVAVAPHLSIDRAIVLPEDTTVSITASSNHQAVLCVDGQEPVLIADGDRIDVFASEHSVQFVRFQDPGYFYRNLTPHMNQNPAAGNQR